MFFMYVHFRTCCTKGNILDRERPNLLRELITFNGGGLEIGSRTQKIVFVVNFHSWVFF
jgi:hypothetical protein